MEALTRDFNNQMPPPHRKRVKHYHEPGDFHELTFSCYQHRRLLGDDARCQLLARTVDSAIRRWRFRLHAFAFMPDHVHLLVTALDDEPSVEGLLKAIKRPHSYQVKMLLTQASDPMLATLTIRERPGVTVFRFWQEGGGYDRNLRTQEAVQKSLDYIHLNPVEAGLSKTADAWRWSSAKWYVSDGRESDPEWPELTRIPADFWD